MAPTLAEHALSRICDYLSASGVELTRDVTREALQLIESGLCSGEEDLLAYVMTRVPERFGLKEIELPVAAPEILRDSIGYGG